MLNIKGATQIFADALTGGDMAKLFDDIKKGKVKVEELNKVIEHMGKLAKPELIANILKNSPEKAFQRLNTAWQRFLMSLNEQGGIGIMVDSLNVLTDVIVAITPHVKSFTETIKAVFKYIKDLANLLMSIGSSSLFQYTAGLTLLGLAFGGLGKNLLRILPLLGKKQGLLLKTAPLLTRIAMGITAIGSAIRGIGIGAFLLLLDDLIVTLKGGDSVLSDVAKGDGWQAWLAKGVIAVGRLVEAWLGGLIALFTGDIKYAEEVFQKFKKDMNDLFPFDSWIEKWNNLFDTISTGLSMAIPGAGPLATAYSLYSSYQKDNNPLPVSTVSNQAMKWSDWSNRPSPLKPVIIENNVTLNGINDPKLIADMVTSEINNKTITAMSNYVMQSGKK